MTTNSHVWGGGGSGGRIRVNYPTALSSFTGQLRARGGVGMYKPTPDSNTYGVWEANQERADSFQTMRAPSGE